MVRGLIVILGLVFSMGLVPAHPVAAYVPQQGDYFNYYETQSVGSGSGSFAPYSDHTIVNGQEKMNSASSSNGTVAAHYSYIWNFSDYMGTRKNGNSSGNFTYSSSDFLYLKGTDNQTGYTNPTVWFLMDSSLPTSGTFYLLDTLMTVKDTSYTYYLSAQSRYVSTIFAEGTGNYQRDDSYGVFSATYTWNAYFDPSTGYIVGYNWNERDTNSSTGDGFAYTEALYVTSTSYALTPTAAPSSGTFPLLYVALGVLLIGLLIIIVVAAVVIRRGRRLPKHSYVRDFAPAPPTVDLTPKQQPAQQIVIKEVVKVKCQYCGALIDSTVQRCPFCGAPRT